MGWLMSSVSCWFLGTLLLVAPCPGASWYKHSASPRYHTVGRASGLLIGVRRSPYLWKRDAKVNPWAIIQPREEENTGLLKKTWIGEGTGPQLSPDPGEKRLIQKLMQENRLRSLEEERNVKEVQDEKRLEEGSWLYNDLGEERSPEDQSQMTRNPEEKERRGLEENMEFRMEPGERKRSPEETWITKEPGEVVRSLEDGQRKMRNQDRHSRSSEESAQERRPSGEDILSMFLHLQEENRSYPQPWRTPTATDKQPFYSKARTSEWKGCEDFRQISYKVLCRAALQFLSRSQPRPGRPRIEARDPEADL